MAGCFGAAIAVAPCTYGVNPWNSHGDSPSQKKCGWPALQHIPLGGNLTLHTSSTCWPMKFSIRLKFTRGQGTGRSIAGELSPLRPLFMAFARSQIVSLKARCCALKWRQ